MLFLAKASAVCDDASMEVNPCSTSIEDEVMLGRTSSCCRLLLIG